MQPFVGFWSGITEERSKSHLFLSFPISKSGEMFAVFGHVEFCVFMGKFTIQEQILEYDSVNEEILQTNETGDSCICLFSS